MKIRTDFVTNSSSSSYVIIKIDSPLAAKVFEELKDLFNSHGFSVGINGSVTELEAEEEYGLYPPTEKEQLPAYIEDLVHYVDKDYEMPDELEEFFNSIASARWEYVDMMYGSDIEPDYIIDILKETDPDMAVDEDELAEEIVNNNDATVTSIFEYDRKSGKEEFTKTAEY